MSDDQAERKYDRIEIMGELLGEVMVYQPMGIKEISLHGAQIETSFPLRVDSLHEVRLILGDTSIVAKGRIVHSHLCDLEGGGGVYRVGVEFVQPSDRVLEAIGEFIEAIAAGRAAS